MDTGVAGVRRRSRPWDSTGGPGRAARGGPRGGHQSGTRSEAPSAPPPREPGRLAYHVTRFD